MISLQDTTTTILLWSPKALPSTLALRATCLITQSKWGLEKTCCHPDVSFILGTSRRRWQGTAGGLGTPLAQDGGPQSPQFTYSRQGTGHKPP